MPKHALCLSIALAFAAPVAAHDAPTLVDGPYPGTITLAVDATDLSRRIFGVRQEIPVQPGPLRLHYPQWLPGNHGPRGPIDEIGGLRFSANGQAVPWRRDPLDMYSFLVEVPAGASTLVAEFQHLSPIGNAPGRVVVTPEIVGLQWNAVTLYPAGYRADKIPVQASVKLPAGWGFGTALEASDGGNRANAAPVQFKPTDLETLIDSPLLAGKHYRQFDLTPAGSTRPVRIEAVADKASELEAKPEIIAAHRRMVEQAYKLFRSQHYDHYDFLLSMSTRYSGIGLEHLQSTEVGVRPGYLIDAKKMAGTEVMPHELVHSWNGKFRRGADQVTPHFNTPMQDSLLWVYEGQTQYWGNVLSARSGMRTPEQARDGLALVAASYEHVEGRTWRSLLDTTNQPIIADRQTQAWRSWQRGEDYYSEGELIWLDADTLIREKTGGKKSLDDFAAAFFGAEDGRLKVLPYTFETVVETLNGVVAHDWASFLRERVEGPTTKAPLDGLARGGWKLVYTDKPNAEAEAYASRGGGGANLSYSLGLSVGSDNKISSVLWNSPAFKAGLAPGMSLVAVNDEAASGEVLIEAVKQAQASKAPIVLLVNSFDRITRVPIEYSGGLRYPHLERIPGTPDRLSQIHAAKK